MENFLRSKEYWIIVDTGVSEVAEGTVLTEAHQKRLDDQKLKDLKAKNYLFQAIDRAILETILQKDTSKQIWDSMKQKYQETTRVKRQQLQALRKDFEILHMKEGESVDEYFSRTLTIANKMRIHGDKLEDVAVVEKILRSMTSNFAYVVCSIEESKDLDELSIDELQSSLLVHEQRMKNSYMEEQALKVSTHDEFPTWRGSNRGRGWGRAGQGRGRGGRNAGRGGFDKSNIECYRCHGYGHFKSECTANLRYDRGEKSNFAEKEDKEEETLLMAYHDQEAKLNVWYLDSGCSNHMCGNKSLFSDLNESFNDTVKLGNNSKISVMGKGNIQLQIGGHTVKICDVFYVPELKSNLISMGQLQEKEYTITIRKGCCQVMHPKKGLIAQITMTANRMFPLHIQHDIQTCFNMQMSDSSWLWHMRYGHLNFNGLKTLQQKTMVTGLPHISCPSKVCEECVVGKQHRDPFPKGNTWRAKKALQLVHSDICGPINPASNSNKRYFITFTDDYSRKTWVYFLQQKSEALIVFKSFKNFVEKESGQEIKVLRTDRGGEFNSNEFMNFCALYGIRRQLTAAYSPQQNGVSERKNRTILNMVRCMLKTSCTPKEFWPEAVNWSVHVLNRSPTVAVKNMTP